MTDEELAEAYRNRMRHGAWPSDAPDPEVIQRVASGHASEAERLRVLDIVMQSEALRREFDVLRALASGHRPASRWPRHGLALAAGLLLTVMAGSLWWRGQSVAPEPFRGGGAAVTLIAPAEGARVSRPPVLTWAAVPGATGYEVEVLAGNGTVVFSAAGPDTTAAWPESVQVDPVGSYVWRVEAALPDGRTLTSTPGTFSGAP